MQSSLDNQGYKLPAVVDPPDTICYQVNIPNDPAYVQAFIGALYDTTIWLSWQRDAAHTAALAAARMKKVWWETVSNPGICGSGPVAIAESDYLMSICEQLRFENGKLQGFCCGEWVDIGGQPTQGSGGGSQPGGGQPQPPAGGCQQYQGSVAGNGQWLLPTAVNTGDTINLTGEQGAFFESSTGVWYCPDGSQFILGVCTAIQHFDAGSPLPSVPLGKIIANIGGTYYDIFPGPFTVPGGISNAQVTLQQNTPALSSGAGNAAFSVQVCNNQPAPWSVDIDLTSRPGPFGNPVDGNGKPWTIWIPGTGWQSNDNGPLFGSTYYELLNLQFNVPGAGIINTMRLDYDDGTSGSGCDNGGVSIGSTFLFVVNCPVTKGVTFIEYDLFTQAYTAGQPFAIVFQGAKNAGGLPSGKITLTHFKASGTGVNPFV